MAKDVGNSIKTILGITTAGSMSTVGAACLDESSVEFGSGGLGVQLDSSSMSSQETSEGSGDSMSTSGEMSSDVSAEAGAIQGTTAMGIVVIGGGGLAVVSAPVSTEATSDSSDGGINVDVDGKHYHIWEDSSGNIVIDKNTVPYSRVEKRAQQAYDVLHGKPAEEYAFPAVIAETKESFDAISSLFGENASPSKVMDTLAILELALQQEKNGTDH